MPVIAIANPKGGSGKSTTALVLGTMAGPDTPQQMSWWNLSRLRAFV
jgi:MinD-like ATPase involved in chromosome partitioning or flagellar assembly